MSENKQKLDKLTQIFNRLFCQSENTQLKTGADEPYYQAASRENLAVIFSREDYFSSALHEIAHWCIAGAERRKLNDFGYWYRPEGRSETEQVEFEQVEIKPQAVEWILSLACDHPFHLSADNLAQDIGASDEFKINVENQAKVYLAKGLPPRAGLLFKQLNLAFRNNQVVELVNV
jgi:elongation factor P hydroxylase